MVQFVIMETRMLNEILTWMKTTDLVELAFKRGSQGFEFRTESAPPVQAAFPASTLVPVASPTVGIFRAGKLGSAPHVQEGGSVTSGQSLGIVEMGSQTVEIKAGCAGRIVKALTQDGDPVEYGQPLFLIAP